MKTTKSLKCKAYKRVSAKARKSMKKRVDSCVANKKADEACLVKNRLCSLRKALRKHTTLSMKANPKAKPCQRKKAGTYSVKQRKALLESCIGPKGAVRESCLLKKGMCVLQKKLKKEGHITLRSRKLKKTPKKTSK